MKENLISHKVLRPHFRFHLFLFSNKVGNFGDFFKIEKRRNRPQYINVRNQFFFDWQPVLSKYIRIEGGDIFPVRKFKKIMCWDSPKTKRWGQILKNVFYRKMISHQFGIIWGYFECKMRVWHKLEVKKTRNEKFAWSPPLINKVLRILTFAFLKTRGTSSTLSFETVHCFKVYL